MQTAPYLLPKGGGFTSKCTIVCFSIINAAFYEDFPLTSVCWTLGKTGRTEMPEACAVRASDEVPEERHMQRKMIERDRRQPRGGGPRSSRTGRP